MTSVYETDTRVPNIEPDLITRFAWRARRRAQRLNAAKAVSFYRWEVQRVGPYWQVVAMQNVAVPWQGAVRL